MPKKIRVMIAKAGLDGHDRGVKIVARGLSEAGIEVIYSGLHQTPDTIVKEAIHAGVDLIGVSILSGAHMTIFPRLMELLEENCAANTVVFGGGIIPDDDVDKLYKIGVKKIFGPGTPLEDIIKFVKESR